VTDDFQSQEAAPFDNNASAAAPRRALPAAPSPRREGRDGVGTVRLFQVLVGLELIFVAVLGIVTVQRMPIQLADELAHYSYVQHVAEQGDLPQLGLDLTSPEAFQVGEVRVPGLGLVPNAKFCPRSDPAVRLNVHCALYEAFQPPLYYVLAAPVYKLGRASLLGGSPRRAFFALRYFGLVLLFLAIGLFFVLARDVIGTKRAWSAFAFGLLVFVLPNTIVHSVLVGNAGLEPVAVVLLLLLLWRAWTGDSLGYLAGSGVALGACLLTRLTLLPFSVLFVAAVVRFAWRHRSIRAVSPVLAVALIPPALIAPWLLDNRAVYGSWTADALARRVQAPVINPGLRPYPVGTVLNQAVVQLRSFAAPQEWLVGEHSSAAILLQVLVVAVIVAIPAMIALAQRRNWRAREIVLLAAPLPLFVIFLAATMLREHWPVMISRYFLAGVLSWGLFACLQWRAVLNDRALARLIVGTLGTIVALWCLFGTGKDFLARPLLW
jgi:hypothetical protein